VATTVHTPEARETFLARQDESGGFPSASRSGEAPRRPVGNLSAASLCGIRRKVKS